jgi:hypothetical protein
LNKLKYRQYNLLSPASKFVIGLMLPIDGGFSAYSGV